jgi:hypothetical protein
LKHAKPEEIPVQLMLHMNILKGLMEDDTKLSQSKLFKGAQKLWQPLLTE